MVKPGPDANPSWRGPAVASWTSEDKLVAAARRAAPHLPASVRADFEALFEPRALAATAAVLAAWAGSHAFGIGFAVDLLLLVVGVITVGALAFAAADALASYVSAAVSARSEADLESAARHLARAVSLIGVQAFVALVTRGAARGALAQNAQRVRLARMKSMWWAKAASPALRERSAVALGFLRKHFGSRGETWWFERLCAIDSSKPIKVRTLEPGTELVAYRQAEYVHDLGGLARGEAPVRKLEPLLGGNFYTKPGVSNDRLGVSSANRVAVRFRVKKRVEVLESTASSAPDTWTAARRASFDVAPEPPRGSLASQHASREVVSGGGVQYLVPNPADALEVLYVPSSPFPHLPPLE